MEEIIIHSTFPIFLTGAQDAEIALWDYKRREQIVSINGHQDTALCAQFHAKKNLIVSCSINGTIILWSFDKLAEKILVESSEKITNNDV